MTEQSEKPKTGEKHAAMIQAIERYVAFDRSDPFIRDRIIAHIKSGAASLIGTDHHGKWAGGKPGYYDAEQGVEHRSFTRSNGEEVEYTVPAFKNMGRP